MDRDKPGGCSRSVFCSLPGLANGVFLTSFCTTEASFCRVGCAHISGKSEDSRLRTASDQDNLRRKFVSQSDGV